MTTRVTAAVLAAGFLAAAGCSSGSGGPSAPNLGGAPAVAFSGQGGATANALVLTLQGSDDRTATFNLELRNPSQAVTGAAVELRFDPGTLSLSGAAAGGAAAGGIARAAVVPGEPGRVIAVFARRDLTSGHGGAGVLGTITLTLGAGSYSNVITLDSATSSLFGVGGAPLSGERFAGGTLTVTAS
ncbi:MAG TPA: hypothetical protein VIC56_01285 [Gemmatimonadota bacterium]|jgi:hypothetical protein